LVSAKRKRGVDLLDAHFGYPEGVSAALLGLVTHTPFIVTLRGNEPMFGASGIRRACIRWALRRAAFVVTVSEQLRQFAIELGVDPARTRVIGNGVDAKIFHPRDRSECRRRYDLPPDAHVVVTAGSLLKAKGHHHVVSAVDKLTGEGMNVYLVVVGAESRGGPGFERQLRGLVDDLGLTSRVRFAGWLPPESLAELMCAADVFCLASDSEGWPNVVHEATSCGTPVVTTDVGSVRDILPSEAYGLIVGLDEQPRLERALRQAFHIPWDRAAIAAWAQSRSWQHVAQDVLTVMRQAVQAR
jgi:glycosyltransferase involved in cell wall biosynthesis